MGRMETPGTLAGTAGGGEPVASMADGRSIAQGGAAGDLWREAVDAGATLADVLSRPGVPLCSAVRLARKTLDLADEWREREGLEPGILAALEAVGTTWTPDFLRTQDDWRREMTAAWRALPAEDRAAFLTRVGRGGAP